MLTDIQILQNKLIIAQSGRTSAIANIAMQTANNANMVNNYDIQIADIQAQLDNLQAS